MTRVIDLSLVELLFLSFSMLRSCPTGWFRLGDTTICLIFVKSSSSDFSWSEADRVCRQQNANLFIVDDSNRISQVETIYRTIRTNSSILIFEKSVWIEKTNKVSTEFVCNSSRTKEIDFQRDCSILTVSKPTETLCIEQVSCVEQHPLICQTEIDKFDARITWWKCIVIIWCLVDKDDDSDEANKAEVQTYMGQFVSESPQEIQSQTQAINQIQPQAQTLSTSRNSPLVIGSLIIVSLLITACITCSFIFIVKKIKHSNGRTNRSSSFQSFD